MHLLLVNADATYTLLHASSAKVLYPQPSPSRLYLAQILQPGLCLYFASASHLCFWGRGGGGGDSQPCCAPSQGASCKPTCPASGGVQGHVGLNVNSHLLWHLSDCLFLSVDTAALWHALQCGELPAAGWDAETKYHWPRHNLTQHYTCNRCNRLLFAPSHPLLLMRCTAGFVSFCISSAEPPDVGCCMHHLVAMRVWLCLWC